MRYLSIILIFISACQSLPDNQIEKFKLLNQALERGVADAREANFASFKTSQKQVQKEGNTLEGLNRIKNQQALAILVYLLLSQIDQIKAQIKDKTPQGAEKLMLGENKNGLAYGLKKSLDQYCHFLIDKYKDIGLDSIVILPLASGKLNLDFAQTNFQNTSSEAMTALLTHIQFEIVKYQQEVLKKHSAGELGKDFSFPSRKIIGVQPVRQAVRAGEFYDANMYLVNILPFDYQAHWDGYLLTPNFRGLYWGELITSKSGNQEVRVAITYPKPNKVDTTCIIMYPYYVFPKNR